jgi:hypothetical protein
MSLGRRFLSFGSIELPVVVTDSTSSVAGTTFTANGTLSSIGGGSGNVSVGFYIGANASYLSNTKYTVSTNASTGAYTYNATGLTAGTTYYITAFAINDGGESVGVTRTQATAFVPNLISQSTSSKLSYTSISQLSLTNQYLDTSTSTYQNAGYMRTGYGGTSTSPAQFNGTAPHILNGCRGNEYNTAYNVSYWTNSPYTGCGSGNCCMDIKLATNTTNRQGGGTWSHYYFDHAPQNVQLYTYAPSGYSLSNRVLSATGDYTSATTNSNTSSLMRNTLTGTAGTNSFSAGLLQHEFDLT